MKTTHFILLIIFLNLVVFIPIGLFLPAIPTEYKSIGFFLVVLLTIMMCVLNITLSVIHKRHGDNKRNM
ncbi:MAG: hypothetical protein BWX59_00835 [Bacteroidetes bacterium ADurb.Bin028]|jgi:NADH:ubiquinone oxidoreductase subunit 3 (subunit A)|nr:MAG: hypothetical protein BWX59_00835 [Bacteroidetes bacterium ADurb.Bin028]